MVVVLQVLPVLLIPVEVLVLLVAELIVQLYQVTVVLLEDT
jgi:hypothetical protein